ncbi:hypothetical protein Bbelb_277950 [Branchiostoma belcheri]|nr:hypothetical protein Bbelb_277950 [Branchiostoma belcheri]
MRALSLQPFLRSRPHREEQQARVAVKPSTVFPVPTCRTSSFSSQYGFQQVASPSTSEAGRNPRRVGQQQDQPGQGRVQQVLPAEGQVQPPAEGTPFRSSSQQEEQGPPPRPANAVEQQRNSVRASEPGQP